MLNSPLFWYVHLLLISKIDSPFFLPSSKHYSIQMRCNLVMTFAVSQNELFLSSVKKRIDILAWWKSGMHTIQNEMYWFAFSLGWNVCCPWELFSSIHIILLLHFILGYLLWRISNLLHVLASFLLCDWEASSKPPSYSCCSLLDQCSCLTDLTTKISSSRHLLGYPNCQVLLPLFHMTCNVLLSISVTLSFLFLPFYLTCALV